MGRYDDVCSKSMTDPHKILRKTMHGIADGRDEPMPATVEDASVLDTVWTVLRGEPR
ncbi:hypothetical protein [Amycolatopsis thermophila]|uniref:Uncharacterized protein n=1 Tax=Amycolatopsis thermophila TaxID=206084 RepID=A0ABU0F3B1_9PSEU|nr:hypothetical protein [Amycolatopsis thermophila]MDQ0381517.1 hypothetical protein [Amycolatopsis thermophila]